MRCKISREFPKQDSAYRLFDGDNTLQNGIFMERGARSNKRHIGNNLVTRARVAAHAFTLRTLGVAIIIGASVGIINGDDRFSILTGL